MRGQASDERGGWVWGLMLAVVLAVAAQQCALEPATVEAQNSQWTGEPSPRPTPPVPAHYCHLFGTTDWVEEGYILQRGWDRGDRLLLFETLEGCECIVYVPEWAPDALSFPMHRRIVLRGITVGAPGQDREILMALGVDERL